MSDTGSSFDEAVRDVPNVPIGTTNLGNWQAATMKNDDGTSSTGPLNGLITPITVEWKVAGQPDECYVEAARTGKLPYVTPASGIVGSPFNPYCMMWEWRGMIIYLTPLTYPADLRVRGEFCFTALTKDTDILQVHPRMAEATAYGTAALIGQERNNATYTQGYFQRADLVLENISNMLVRSEQGTTTRIGRVGGRGPYGNGFGGRY